MNVRESGKHRTARRRPIRWGVANAIEGAHSVARETGGGGGLVYQLGTATVKGKTGKLSPSWKGPGVVIEKLTPYL